MYSPNYGLGKDREKNLETSGKNFDKQVPSIDGNTLPQNSSLNAPERIEGEPALLYAFRLNDWRKATVLPADLDQYYKEQSIAIINSAGSGARPTGQAETVVEAAAESIKQFIQENEGLDITGKDFPTLDDALDAGHAFITEKQDVIKPIEAGFAPTKISHWLILGALSAIMYFAYGKAEKQSKKGSRNKAFGY